MEVSSCGNILGLIRDKRHFYAECNTHIVHICTYIHADKQLKKKFTDVCMFIKNQGGDILVETELYLNYFSQIPWERLRTKFAYWKLRSALINTCERTRSRTEKRENSSASDDSMKSSETHISLQNYSPLRHKGSQNYHRE